jgi:thiol-disulfide isomerase/thioredoxin
MKLFAFIFYALVGAISVQTVASQIRVPVRIDETTRSFATLAMFCDEKYRCGLFQNESTKTAKEAGILTQVSRTASGFFFRVDTNGDGKLTDDKKLFLKKSSRLTVKVRQRANKHYSLFEISHERDVENGTPVDSFSLTPHYVGTARLEYRGCRAKVSLTDLNFDGTFTAGDGRRGTNLGIDRNNDGRISGKDEHLSSSEIIEFCGHNFLVSAMSWVSITLSPTDLKIAKVNAEVPQFSVGLLNGKSIGSNELRGTNYILDFWASWCIPCVNSIPRLKALGSTYRNNVTIYSINVDKASEREIALKIIRQNEIDELSAVRGLGHDDPFWKTFGGANKLTIPLYVLIDKDGILRYADYGGDNLSELEVSIKDLISEN